MKDDPDTSAYPRKIKVKEEFYQKRYTTGGYKPVGKNKRMDQSNKRSGDSKHSIETYIKILLSMVT